MSKEREEKNRIVIETRYRDIPWEEAVKCYRLDSGAYPVDKVTHEEQVKHWDKRFRGKPVRIIAPPDMGPQWEHVLCKGPFYRVDGLPRHMVCPHLAEIGD